MADILQAADRALGEKILVIYHMCFGGIDCVVIQRIRDRRRCRVLRRSRRSCRITWLIVIAVIIIAATAGSNAQRNKNCHRKIGQFHNYVPIPLK